MKLFDQNMSHELGVLFAAQSVGKATAASVPAARAGEQVIVEFVPDRVKQGRLYLGSTLSYCSEW